MKKPRSLTEQTAVSTESGVRIDRAGGVIYGVRVLGRFSRNDHDAEGVSKGTEYPPETQKAALPLIEGQTVRTDHPPRDNPQKTRSCFETLGILRNARMENRGGEDGIVADLHCYPSHDMTSRVMDDIEFKINKLGLSINAYSGKERVQDGRLVIEEISDVLGVDLVDRPATTRSLIESTQTPPEKTAVKTKKVTIRSVLEGLMTKPARKGGLTPARTKWAKRLLEMDDSIPVDTSGDMPAEGPAADDPDAMLAAGFKAAINAVLDSTDMDAKGKLGKIGDLLKTQEKLLQQPEPEEPPVQESEDEPGGDEGDDKKKKDDSKQESEKAKKPKGKPVMETEEQKELDGLRREKKVRSLCESLDYSPTPSTLKALCALDTEADRKALIEEQKGKGGKPGAGSNTTRSMAWNTQLIESEQSGGGSGKAPDLAAEINALRNGGF